MKGLTMNPEDMHYPMDGSQRRLGCIITVLFCGAFYALLFVAISLFCCIH